MNITNMTHCLWLSCDSIPTCWWLEWPEHLNNSGIQHLNTLLCTQFLQGPKLKGDVGKERELLSTGETFHPRTRRRLAHHSAEQSTAAGEAGVYLPAFPFLPGLSSQWDFLICLKYCKFPEYGAHPCASRSTKTHCKAKHQRFLGY